MTRRVYREQLISGWEFRQSDNSDDEWLPVAKVPTVVHLDLKDNKRISDPFIGLNELDVEWVGEKPWSYRRTFARPPIHDGESCHLVFEGLDTFATVKLNGVTVLTSDNMFLSHRVDVTEHLQPTNTLVIDFASALLRARELEKEHAEHRYIAANGEAARIGVRKAQYHWGWDWGPVLMTAGPWRPVSIKVSSAHIVDTFVRYETREDLGGVTGHVEVQAEGAVDVVRVTISHQGDVVFSGAATPSDNQTVHVPFKLDSPQLWYPAGYGDQNLYDVTTEIIKNDIPVDIATKKTGFRRVELVRDEDGAGESFYFRVNGIDIFAGGSCWIPADSFLPQITAERYRNWVKLLREGNQVMIRVWGGGIYEDDSFYEACDEFGILVWQDFMFACASYPAWESLRQSVEQEARQNVRRLRRHPSIVLYCGNNEDYQTQEYYKLDYEFEDGHPDTWLKGTFPARYYYEHLLPLIVTQDNPGVPYWAGSPFSSKGREANDSKAGDIHQWSVWHGWQDKYQTFDQNGGRFVSEFGLQALPQLSTVHDFASSPSDLFTGSRSVDFHNKAHGHERRIATYVVENFGRMAPDLGGHIYLSQLMQSEALSYAYKGWRRQWGEDRLCGGALVWQLNDCWPCTSWAVVDYHLRKKPGFHAIARHLRPVVVCAQREHQDWTVGHVKPAATSSFKVWIASSKTDEVVGDVEIRFVSIATGSDIKPAVRKSDITVAANGTTIVFTGEVDNKTEEPHVIAVRVFSNDGEVIARDVDWPQPLKYVSFADRGVKVEAHKDGYRISAERPTKGLTLDEVDGISLSDNCIDVVPGDTQIIKSTGAGTVPQYRYLGQTSR